MANKKLQQYNIALGDQGYILQGTPTKIARSMKQMPLFENRFASGDRGFGDFSYRWFWAQESFIGMKNQDWQDDGYIQYSTNLNLSQIENKDPYMEKQATLKTTFSSDYDYITSAYFNSRDQEIDIAVKGDSTHPPALFYTTDGTSYTAYTFFSTTPANGSKFYSLNASPNCYVGVSVYPWFYNDAGSHQLVNETAPYTDTPDHSGSISDGWLIKTILGENYAIYSISNTLVLRKYVSPSWVKQCEQTFASLKGGDFIYFAGDSKYYLLALDPANNSTAYLYQWTGSGNLILAHTWNGKVPGQYEGCGHSLYEYNNKMYILLKDISTGRSEIWSMNSSGILSKEYISTADAESSYTALKTDFQYGFVEHNGLLYCTGAVTDGTYWWGGNLASTNGFAPLVSAKLSGDSEYYLWGTSNSGTGNNLKLDKLDSTTGTDYAYLETNKFFASMPNTDKIWIDLTLNFDTFVEGSEIKVYYDIGSGFTLLGTIDYATQGGINNYIFNLPANTISKHIRLKFCIKGYSTILQNYTLSYLPSVNIKYQWDLSIITMYDMILLDGTTKESKTPETIKAVLRNDYYKKNSLDFQDIDYAETTLTDDPLTASAVTVNVSSTSDFPEQGRIKIDNEEILYTGRTATAFTGCTRGARGTTAISHTANSTVHNGYKVLISNYAESTPIGTDSKVKESIISLTLIEI